MKRKIISLILAAICLACSSVLFVAANPTEAPATEAVTSPAPTDPPTIPAGTTSGIVTQPTDIENPSVPASSGVYPPGSSAPLESAPTEPASTVPVTRPTEFQEDPGFTSDYIAPPPAFIPGEHDVQKNEWEELVVEEIVKEAEDKQLSIQNNGGVDAESFNFIKENKSKTDEKNPTLFILSLVFWFVALALATLAILYRPRKKTAGADTENNTKGKKGKKNSSHRYAGRGRSGSSDDYNDGY